MPSGYRAGIEYVSLIVPALATTWVALSRPPPGLLVALAVAVVIAEVPVIWLLAEAGGVGCPGGCGTEQGLLLGLSVLALPLTLCCLLVAAGLSGRRGRRRP